jgi:hypothetical protein
MDLLHDMDRWRVPVECGKETSDSIKYEQFLDYLRNC